MASVIIPENEAVAVKLPTDWASPLMRGRVAARYRAERLFKLLGLAALSLAGLFLAFLLFTIVRDGWTGFKHTEVRISVSYDPALLGVDPAAATGPGGLEAIRRGDYIGLMQRAAAQLGPAANVVSDGAWLDLRQMVEANPAVLGTTQTVWVPVRSSIDLLAKGKFDLKEPEISRGVSNDDVASYNLLETRGLLKTSFNTIFTGAADSTDPELAGVWGAALGTFMTLLVTIALAFPVGVLAAIWLEEFAAKNRWTDLIEVSINNLAAVPSIIFGLLGLAVFLNFFNMPRSAPLVGGLTLALMTLPVVVITARVAIKSVPPSIRDAALGIGASPMQVVFQHVLPLAMPGIMTGTIIGMARALGETAPLLLIGMRAFVTDTPQGFASPATVLPVQVFLWSDDVQRGFIEKTSAAIIVLLVMLLLMNSAAIYLRNKFERRW
ncbi:phosphate transport system permease protein PstA [Polymorphobacter glacialis]|uniref:Phosphate transport system permease protein PstA n=1 Tax=Sandarakinorhabdus glacialis TaxID=1614636 RepID=A0A917E2X3_9SPHN|nr:phosphate ABC transporter permease PstA [Polymorphobacter glacialis]GGD99836.1 phosphate transport system permease protein PstA [Polymorphobacter glacialis]